ncbi:MAG TPA: hypothetical protein VJ001_01715 [Rhodocyclaceae bacterium]|nr:hypothetical protein [Rhodocyclaceae bacterium]
MSIMTWSSFRNWGLAFAGMVGCVAAMAESGAQKPAAKAVALPPGVTEEMLAPPPVPRFMLEKPTRQLSMEEMVQQAREAEKKAGIPPKAAASPPPSPSPSAAGKNAK